MTTEEIIEGATRYYELLGEKCRAEKAVQQAQDQAKLTERRLAEVSKTLQTCVGNNIPVRSVLVDRFTVLRITQKDITVETLTTLEK